MQNAGKPARAQAVQNLIPAGMIDLGVGDPQFDLLPLETLHRSVREQFDRGDPYFLQYGAEGGDGVFRSVLAEFLGSGYGLPVEPESLFITTGASTALDLICTLFTKPGDIILVEEPTFFLALRIFADHGLQAISVPMDADGLVIPAVREATRAHWPKFLYTVPTHQNPSSICLPAQRREQLVALSREFGFLVVADEVYHLLSYGVVPPPAFGTYSQNPNVLSLGSFSKILAPGLRLGWIQAHPERVQQFSSCGLLDSGGGLNPFTSAMVSGMVQNGGLTENIEHLQTVYSGRVAAMEAALGEYLPEARFQTPRGGYFFWVQLPGGIDAQGLLPLAEAHGVRYRPGGRFSSRNGLHDHIRIGFTFYSEDEIRQGIARLAMSIRAAG